MAEADPILTGLDAVRAYLRAQYTEAEHTEDADIRTAQREQLSKLMAHVDNACDYILSDAR